MKYAIALILLLLVGCSTTVPVVAKFPEMPATLLAACPQLQKLQEETKLSEIAKTITVNYSIYHECTVKHGAIVEWYETQKKIFESVK